MEQLIWLAVNLYRSRLRSSEGEQRREQCLIDTIDNEVFKSRYYDSKNKLVDIFAEAKMYDIGTYNTFKLMSKRFRVKEDSIVQLRYNREDAKDIVSVIFDCFDLNLYQLPQELSTLSKDDLYIELMARYNQDERIHSRLITKSDELILLLELNNPVLSTIDLTQTKVWDFKLERFPLQKKKTTSPSKLFSAGNIIALSLAAMFIFLIIKYLLPSK